MINLIAWVLGFFLTPTKAKSIAPNVGRGAVAVLALAALAFAGYKVYDLGRLHQFAESQKAIDKCYGDWNTERGLWNETAKSIREESAEQAYKDRKELEGKYKGLEEALEAYKNRPQNKPETPEQKTVNNLTCTGGLSFEAVRTLRGVVP